MTKFTCDGFKPVIAQSSSEAANIFAQRLARRKYGRLGRVAALRDDGYTDRSITYSTFIGRLHKDAGVVEGGNEWLILYFGNGGAQ